MRKISFGLWRRDHAIRSSRTLQLRASPLVSRFLRLFVVRCFPDSGSQIFYAKRLLDDIHAMIQSAVVDDDFVSIARHEQTPQPG